MNIPTNSNGVSDDTSLLSIPMNADSTICATSSSSTMTTTGTSNSTKSSNNNNNPKQFHLFMNLQYELQIIILSYVATAPFENRTMEDDDNAPSILYLPSIPGSTITCPSLMYTSTLTHIIPFVCKSFYNYHCKDDTLWKDALIRQLLFHEPKLWYNALQNIIMITTNENTTCNNNNRNTEGTTNDSMLEQREQPGTSKDDIDHINQLIERAYHVVVSSSSTASSVSNNNKTNGNYYYYLYRTILNTQLRVICPVFIMDGDVILNEPYGLHLYEYRYRYMIFQLLQQHDTMIQHNISDINLSSITSIDRSTLLEKYPIYFIHANRGNVRRSEMAVIVQLIHCTTHVDGRADIVIKPVHYIWIERSWLYTNNNNNNNNNSSTTNSTSTTTNTNNKVVSSLFLSPPHNLYYAQGLKMGYEATNAMNYLQRQETLTTIMERLIASGLLVQEQQRQRQQHDIGNDDDDDNDNGIDVDDNDINALQLAGIDPVHLQFLTQMNHDANDSSDDDEMDDADDDDDDNV